VEHLFGWMSQIILALALPYFVITLILGVRVAHRDGSRLNSQESLPDPEEGGSHEGLYFLVPCLNEEMVIGATVRRLLDQPGCTVIVIDDGSSDETAARARSAAAAFEDPTRLVLLTRAGEDSRRGKGAALNAAFPLVLRDVEARGFDPADVVVAVMDADGALSPGAVDSAMELFEDPQVGGVQLIVRIRDRRKLIAQFQDIEFWMISALSQFARSTSGTVSLGGNGQFTRLSALQELNGDPWSRSLTEDLDLGLRLIAAGWRVTTTTRAYVDQQAVDTFGRLLRQRRRWYQGHMDSMRRLPEVWRSDQVSEVAILEVTSYLLVPWLIVLPWSILQQWIIYQIFFGSGHGIFASGLGGASWRVSYALLWYVLSFAPNILIGFVYSRRTRAVTLRRALVLGHLMIAWNYVGYIAAWGAVFRMVRGRTNWDKTTRSTEPVKSAILQTLAPRPVVADAVPPKRVMFVFGTRPEAVKLAPIIRAMAALPTFTPVVVVTGQHRAMLDQVNDFFGIEPDYDLDIMEDGQSLTDVTVRAMQGLDPLMEECRPDAVVVQGDTTSSLVGALAAFYHGVPVVHVEAGLRTFDPHSPFPEEINRQLTTRLADLHLAPTSACKENLVREGIAPEAIVVTGNTVIDALQWGVAQGAPYGDAALERLDDDARPVLLVTAHRRESWGPAMEAVGRALGRIAALEPDLTVVVPVHMNATVREALLPPLEGRANVIVTEPLGYGGFCRLMNRASVVLTDSGGLQEEAPSLGKPVLVLRDTTERQEAIACGTARLIGTDEERVVDSVRSLLHDDFAYRTMANAVNPYGDGDAADRTVDALERFLVPTAALAPGPTSRGGASQPGDADDLLQRCDLLGLALGRNSPELGVPERLSA
jgi:UDP-N-acetylglucosamine 2-epimerase (non-hydrolysing)